MIQIRRSSVVTTMGIAALAAFPFAVSAATLSINGCTGFTFESDGSITCVTSTPPPPPAGAPTGCTVTPPSVSLGATSPSVPAPSVSCSGGPAITGIAWSRLGAPVTFPQQLPSNTTASVLNYVYSGSVCAGAACTTVSYSATVSAGATSPPTTASCGDRKVITPALDTNSAVTTLAFTGQRYVTSGFAGVSTIVVSKIEVPANISGATTLAIYEYGSAATNRKAWLSKTMCDMSAGLGSPYYRNSGGPVFSITTGTAAPTDGSAWMQPGEVWYLMVKNEKFSSTYSSCPTGNCEVGIKLYLP